MKSILSIIILVTSIHCTSNISTQIQQKPFSVTPDFRGITWVAYSPTNFNPNIGLYPSAESIQKDLEILAKAGFTGLVTYGSEGILGQELHKLAENHGFKGIILGIWDIQNNEEIENTRLASKSKIVKGFCVGNEGLDVRYNFEQLKHAIDTVSSLTGKPVTTTEQIEDYSNEKLLLLGDWIFPNVHPYWHGKYQLEEAVTWTTTMYDDLVQRSNKPVLLKEVGFPTANDDVHGISEILQEKYYTSLEQQSCNFVWFEAFDMIWKTHEAVEPHWGLFKADRTPKSIGKKLILRSK